MDTIKTSGVATSMDFKKLIRLNSITLDSVEDLYELVNKIGDAKYVLLGEASHGTHEYYTWRARLSKLLIEKKGFTFVAVEGDWPDCYRINRYIKGYTDAGQSAYDVLHQFNRWPTWMWANWEIVAFAEWLRKHNDKLAKPLKTGFYGLDVYSLWESLEAIIQYLDKVDPKAKEVAMKAFSCFEPYSYDEGRSYAQAMQYMPVSCEKEVVNLLTEIIRKIPQYNTDHEAVLSTEQNAHVIAGAEKYYRAMIKPGPGSWNIRDRHMVATLDRLMKFHGKDAKAIIWEHNTHIGDARATDMAAAGMVNVGQLLREQYGDEVYTVGFGSYHGTVMAGREWGDEQQVMSVPNARNGSWESMLHAVNEGDSIIFMNDHLKQAIGSHRIDHRAIGVVYDPRYEYLGNYVPTILPQRYDAFIFLDYTKALHPLHINTDKHQIPETYPFGM